MIIVNLTHVKLDLNVLWLVMATSVTVNRGIRVLTVKRVSM